jgi:hypothetical protein
MHIDIDEAKIKEYVDEAVERKVDTLTDEIIKERVQKVLFDRVDGIFSNYSNDIRYCVDKHVREIVKERAEINPEQFDAAARHIADDIAYNLRNIIVDSVAYRLLPNEEEDDDE